VEAIAVGKVRAVEDSIRLVHALKNEVGSYALMRDSGFGQSDFLQCCKFAEGDSRILMQKMSRDRMHAHSSAVKKGTLVPPEAGTGECVGDRLIDILLTNSLTNMICK
jgi:acyl-CoA oxidase